MGAVAGDAYRGGSTEAPAGEATRPLRQIAVVVAFASLLAPAPGLGFVPLHREPDPQGSPRWSAGAHAEIGFAGLQGGLRVAVEPGFAAAIVGAVTGAEDPADIAAVEVAVAAAFDAWTSPVLRFEIEFDGPAERGTGAGAEIDLFAVPGTDPVFADNTFFGLASWRTAELAARELTNGTVLPGPALIGADLFFNLDRLALAAPLFTREQQPAAIQRLVMHELGHAIGLNHPNQYPQANLDTDDDPFNEMIIDPRDPFAGLVQSPNVDADAVMSNSPVSGLGPLLFTTLRNDDRGGRDVLYPALIEPRPACTGDCDGDGAVDVDELVLAVRIARGLASLDACPAFTADEGDGIEDAELVLAVRHALEGCAPAVATRARAVITDDTIGCGLH